MPRCSKCGQPNVQGITFCAKCGGDLVQDSAKHPLPNDRVRKALAEGRKVDAVKLFREQTGMTVTDAKAAVEAYERGEVRVGGQRVARNLEDQLLALVQAGNTVAAVRLYREARNANLREAKDAVDAIALRNGIRTTRGAGCTVMLALLALVIGVGGIVMLLSR